MQDKVLDPNHNIKIPQTKEWWIPTVKWESSELSGLT